MLWNVCCDSLELIFLLARLFNFFSWARAMSKCIGKRFVFVDNSKAPQNKQINTCSPSCFFSLETIFVALLSFYEGFIEASVRPSAGLGLDQSLNGIVRASARIRGFRASWGALAPTRPLMENCAPIPPFLFWVYFQQPSLFRHSRILAVLAAPGPLRCGPNYDSLGAQKSTSFGPQGVGALAY